MSLSNFQSPSLASLAKSVAARLAMGLAVGLGASVGLLGCTAPGGNHTDGAIGKITPYRIDIVQGNAITKEQAALIRPGLSRLQVRDILGSPLLTDPFHADRWDYLFTMRRQGTEPQRRSVVVTFKDDKVLAIEATGLPTEREFVAGLSRHKDPRAPKLELTDQERSALPAPARREAAASEPMGAIRSYPPLEPQP